MNAFRDTAPDPTQDDPAALLAERDRELADMRRREAATAEILGAVARSPADAGPVFEAILAACQRLFGSDEMGVYTVGADGMVRMAAWRGPRGQEVSGDVSPLDDSVTGRILRERRLHHIPDLRADPDISSKVRERVERLGSASLLYAPMIAEDQGLGSILVVRAPPRPFSEKEKSLLQTFADQAAVAVRNARQFRETQEALAQQTATADVLKVISRSAFDLGVVYDALLRAAVGLLGANRGSVSVREGETFVVKTVFSSDPAFQKVVGRTVPPNRATLPGRVLLSARTEVIRDTELDPLFRGPTGFPARSGVAVPLLRHGRVEGALALAHSSPDAFSPKDVALLETFADQAVIAIENARLFDEVQARTRDLGEALAQQTATADVLKVISRSAFDLDAVLDTLIGSATRLCAAQRGSIFLRDGDAFRYRASSNAAAFPDWIRHLTEHPPRAGRGSAIGRAILTGATVCVPDVLADPEIAMPASLANIRAVLAVPLVRDGGVEGIMALSRPTPGPFSARQIELVETFADQAVIAIENARLFGEVQARTRELERSLADLSKAQDRLVQSEKLASLGQLTAGIAHEIKNPLNFVNNFASLSRELLEELREPLRRLPDDARADADELIGLIDSNLEKVASHGRRADSIVKTMLLHAREGSGERTRVGINAMVEEALGLAYHGARAERPGFDVTIEKALDPEAGEAELSLQDVTRVLLNIVANGFYAVKKRRESDGPAHQPTLRVTTRNLGDAVEIRIYDNGAGVPDDLRAKIFHPFFTTKPPGEGTGLGLSLAHDIVVKQHGGTLDVETAPGAFTEFVVTLPRGKGRA